MPAGASNARARRLWALTAALLVLALALFAKYRAHPDTVSIRIIGHAVSAPPGTDSTYYMQMGEDAFRSPPHLIYQKLFFVDHQKFIYPPSSLFLLELVNAAPRVHLTPETALRTLLLLGWTGILVAAVCIYRAVSGSTSMLESACVVLLGILFLPVAEALYRGQVQLLMTCLWGIAILLWLREKPGCAGFVIALTCAFKPQLAVFLIWGLLRRQWRFTLVLTATLGVIAVGSIAHFGLRNNLDYLPLLGYLGRHGEVLWANQSFNGLLNRLLRNGDPVAWQATVYPPYRAGIYLIGTALSAIVLLVALLLPRLAGWQSTLGDFLFLGCSSVLLSPIAWEHHYAYFYFVIVYLLAGAGTLPLRDWMLLCACTLAMANRLPPLDHRQRGVGSLAGSYLLYSGIVVLALLAMEQRRGRTRLARRAV